MFKDVTIYIPSYDNGEWHEDHRHDIGEFGYETYKEAEKEIVDKGYKFKVTEWEDGEEINEYHKKSVVNDPAVRINSAFATIKEVTLQKVKVMTRHWWGEQDEEK